MSEISVIATSVTTDRWKTDHFWACMLFKCPFYSNFLTLIANLATPISVYPFFFRPKRFRLIVIRLRGFVNSFLEQKQFNQCFEWGPEKFCYFLFTEQRISAEYLPFLLPLYYKRISCVIVWTLFFYQPKSQILLRCICCDKMCSFWSSFWSTY